MDELNPTVREQEIYEEMELTPEMVKSIRTLCGTCLRHFVDAKAFKIALVPSADRSMDTCTVCQMRRGYDCGHAPLTPTIPPYLERSPLWNIRQRALHITTWRYNFAAKLEIPTRRHLLHPFRGEHRLGTAR